MVWFTNKMSATPVIDSMVCGSISKRGIGHDHPLVPVFRRKLAMNE